jgi:ferredoxin
MSALQITAIVLCLIVPSLGWILLFRRVWKYSQVFRMGTADPTRTDRPLQRTWVVIKEFLFHTRMKRLPIVSLAHWFVAVSFFVLFSTLVNAFFQLVWPEFRLPIIGHFPPFEWLVELLGWGGLVGIIALILIRQKNHPRKAAGIHGRRSRFFGSTWWQAYYVEATILGVTIMILLLRSLEARMVQIQNPEESLALHFPLTGWMAGMWTRFGAGTEALPQLYEAIYIFAMLKILISFAWMIVISCQPTMGVAWHRFLAFVNIWFKREASGRTALGAVRPMLSPAGTPMTLADIEAMGEEEPAEGEEPAEPRMGVGKAEDFSWKSLLDFTTCTECGRCQSQCPAWNTDKPLSPKLLVMTLRDHAHEKAPWILASEDTRHDEPKHIKRLEEMPPDRRHGLRGEVPPRGVRRPRPGRDHRPGRPVVVHELWRVRRAVPGRHRARGPHRRHAPLPGAHRVELPASSGNVFKQPGDARATRGAWNPKDRTGVDRRAWTSKSQVGVDVESLGRSRLAVLGRLRGRLRRPRQEDHPRRSPNCSTSPASSSRSWARARPAPATRHAAPATRSSSRCSRAERRDR